MLKHRNSNTTLELKHKPQTGGFEYVQLQNKGSGGQGVHWSRAATLGSRRKAVTSPYHHPALQAAQRFSRASFKSRNAARGDVSKNAAIWTLSLMILIYFDLCLASYAVP